MITCDVLKVLWDFKICVREDIILGRVRQDVEQELTRMYLQRS
jgi:hypothetical protein